MSKEAVATAASGGAGSTQGAPGHTQAGHAAATHASGAHVATGSGAAREAALGAAKHVAATHPATTKVPTVVHEAVPPAVHTSLIQEIQNQALNWEPVVGILF